MEIQLHAKAPKLQIISLIDLITDDIKRNDKVAYNDHVALTLQLKEYAKNDEVFRNRYKYLEHQSNVYSNYNDILKGVRKHLIDKLSIKPSKKNKKRLSKAIKKH